MTETQRTEGGELKPCPFCGGPARVFKKYLGTARLNWRVACDNFDSKRGELCDMAIYSDFETQAEAIAAWNRRSTDRREGEDSSAAGAGPFAQWQPIETAPKDGTREIAQRVMAAAEGRPIDACVLGWIDTVALARAYLLALDISDERFAELKRAQGIIDGLKDYRESLLTCPLETEPAGRARIKELCTPPRDDHDRAVLLLIADHERLIRAVASPITPVVRSEPKASEPLQSPSTRREEVIEVQRSLRALLTAIQTDDEAWALMQDWPEIREGWSALPHGGAPNAEFAAAQAATDTREAAEGLKDLLASGVLSPMAADIVTTAIRTLKSPSPSRKQGGE